MQSPSVPLPAHHPTPRRRRPPPQPSPSHHLLAPVLHRHVAPAHRHAAKPTQNALVLAVAEGAVPSRMSHLATLHEGHSTITPRARMCAGPPMSPRRALSLTPCNMGAPHPPAADTHRNVVPACRRADTAAGGRSVTRGTARGATWLERVDHLRAHGTYSRHRRGRRPTSLDALRHGRTAHLRRSLGPTAGTRTSLTASHTVAVAEGAVPPPADGLPQPERPPSSSHASRLSTASVYAPGASPRSTTMGTAAASPLARPPLTDSATLTLCATAHPSPATVLSHHLSPAFRGDKPSRTAVAMVAMVAIESCRPAPPPMAPPQTLHRQSSSCSWLSSMRSAPPPRARRHGALDPARPPPISVATSPQPVGARTPLIVSPQLEEEARHEELRKGGGWLNAAAAGARSARRFGERGRSASVGTGERLVAAEGRHEATRPAAKIQHPLTFEDNAPTAVAGFSRPPQDPSVTLRPLQPLSLCYTIYAASCRSVMLPICMVLCSPPALVYDICGPFMCFAGLCCHHTR
ncbi:hypothetical protein HYPSUDRAFT_207388 [Hypholoma sublateritium FD-334 SS-4]|uniref:Uncharacterized protein n=1 Tax=Hypholoma sublateritium (strain FD-334 SS-4) TaxID=945553 RepID=A0A0D2LYW0_HYPSF|nr:hypothetical protein HYPSUDRAFT_207388 [Hypholoma sublateritium FD-334 SS-4]